MRLMICEFFTSGSLAGAPLPAGPTAEGDAMVQALLADCLALPGVQVGLLRDRRLPLPAAEPHQLEWVEPSGFTAALLRLVAWSEAAWLVAPEPELAALTRIARGSGRLVLGSTPEAIELAGDKWACHRRLSQAGVPVPPTRLARARRRPPQVPWGYPLVVKPRRGCGCQGASVVQDAGGWPGALGRLEAAGGGGGPGSGPGGGSGSGSGTAAAGGYIVQPFLPGQAASVSLLAGRGGRAVALSLNRQDIVVETDGALAYRGGAVPLEHPAGAAAKAAAVAAVAALPGLQGYVGVDLVLSGDQCWMIEVNPRLTTSYVGLRRVCPINLAGAVMAAALGGPLPPAPALAGCATFGAGEEVPVC